MSQIMPFLPGCWPIITVIKQLSTGSHLRPVAWASLDKCLHHNVISAQQTLVGCLRPKHYQGTQVETEWAAAAERAAAANSMSAVETTASASFCITDTGICCSIIWLLQPNLWMRWLWNRLIFIDYKMEAVRKHQAMTKQQDEKESYSDPSA